MKETIVLENYLKKTISDLSFDFTDYVEDTGGEIVERISNDDATGAACLLGMTYGNWKVILGSTASIESSSQKDSHYICRSLIDVTGISPKTNEFCAYYGEWDPEGDDVIFDTETSLAVPMRTLTDFHKLITSGNLNGDNMMMCPFHGTGIKHREMLEDGKLLAHGD